MPMSPLERAVPDTSIDRCPRPVRAVLALRPPAAGFGVGPDLPTALASLARSHDGIALSLADDQAEDDPKRAAADWRREVETYPLGVAHIQLEGLSGEQFARAISEHTTAEHDELLRTFAASAPSDAPAVEGLPERYAGLDVYRLAARIAEDVIELDERGLRWVACAVESQRLAMIEPLSPVEPLQVKTLYQGQAMRISWLGPTPECDELDEAPPLDPNTRARIVEQVLAAPLQVPERDELGVLYVWHDARGGTLGAGATPEAARQSAVAEMLSAYEDLDGDLDAYVARHLEGGFLTQRSAPRTRAGLRGVLDDEIPDSARTEIEAAWDLTERRAERGAA